MDTEKKVQFVALTKEEIDAMIQQAALAGAQVASDAKKAAIKISHRNVCWRIFLENLCLENKSRNF